MAEILTLAARLKLNNYISPKSICVSALLLPCVSIRRRPYKQMNECKGSNAFSTNPTVCDHTSYTNGSIIYPVCSPSEDSIWLPKGWEKNSRSCETLSQRGRICKLMHSQSFWAYGVDTMKADGEPGTDNIFIFFVFVSGIAGCVSM